jgi:hypothetical protein
VVESAARQGKQVAPVIFGEAEHLMPVDFAQVDWLHVAVLTVFAFTATALANLLSLDRWISAWTAAVLFAVMLVFWTYPRWHSVPTFTADQRSTPSKEVTVSPTGTTAPQRPLSPVRDITPPR